MGTATPNVSANTFDATRFFQKVIQLQNQALTDYDYNESQDLLVYRDFLLNKALFSSGARIENGFRCSTIFPTPAANNFLSLLGYAIINGSVIYNDTSWYYNAFNNAGSLIDSSYSNRVDDGVISSTNNISLEITDVNKDWNSYHDLTSCRVVMTSGSEIGNVFNIQGTWQNGWSSNKLRLGSLGSSGGISVNDTYVILPPVLTTFNTSFANTERNDVIYIQLMFSYINSDEEDYLPSTSNFETSQRLKMHWCVRVAEGSETATGSMIDGVVPTNQGSDQYDTVYFKLADLVRDDGDTTINTSEMTMVDGVVIDFAELSQEIKNARESEWGGTYTNLDNRLEAIEDVLAALPIKNGNFEQGSTVGSDITGWFINSNGDTPTTAFKLDNASPYSGKYCLKIDHSGFNKSLPVTSSLSSYPFYISPGAKIKLSGFTKTDSTATINIYLDEFTESQGWFDTPNTSTAILVSNTTAWAESTSEITLQDDSKWARVRIKAANQEVDKDVYIDSIKGIYIEGGESFANTEFNLVETFSDNFNNGSKLWIGEFNSIYPFEIETHASDISNLKITVGSDNPIFSSVPISIGSTSELDDFLNISMEVRYDNTEIRNLSGQDKGPGYYVEFLDSELETLSTSTELLCVTFDNGEQVYVTNINNPDNTDYNIYSSSFEVPKNTEFYRIVLITNGFSGIAYFRNIKMFRVSKQINLNKNVFNILDNGEFGCGYGNNASSDPARNTFSIDHWELEEETTSQVIHWVKGSAKYGDRHLLFDFTSIPDTDSVRTVYARNYLTTNITQEMRRTGITLEFYYKFSDRIDDYLTAELDLLDSTGTSVAAPLNFYTASTGTDVASWTKATVSTAISDNAVKIMVRLSASGVRTPTTGANLTYKAYFSAISLWCQTSSIPSWNNELTDNFALDHKVSYESTSGAHKSLTWEGDYTISTGPSYKMFESIELNSSKLRGFYDDDVYWITLNADTNGLSGWAKDTTAKNSSALYLDDDEFKVRFHPSGGGFGAWSDKLSVNLSTGATTITGSLSVTGASTFNDDVVISAGKDLAIGGTLEVDGISTFNDDVVISAGKDLAIGGTLGVTGATTLGSTLAVTGISTLNNVVNIIGVSSHLSIGGNLTVTGTSTLTGDVSLSNDILLTTGNEIKLGNSQEGRIYYDGSELVLSSNSGSDNIRLIGDIITNNNIYMDSDSTKLRFGEDQDFSIYFNGTDLVIEQDVGSGVIKLDQDIQIVGDITSVQGITTTLHSVIRVLPATIAMPEPVTQGTPGSGLGWEIRRDTNRIYWQCNDINTEVYYPITLPIGAVITDITINYLVPSGTMTSRLYQDANDSSSSTSDFISGASTSWATMSITGLSIAVVSTMNYNLSIVASAADSKVGAVEITYSQTNLLG